MSLVRSARPCIFVPYIAAFIVIFVYCLWREAQGRLAHWPTYPVYRTVLHLAYAVVLECVLLSSKSDYRTGTSVK